MFTVRQKRWTKKKGILGVPRDHQCCAAAGSMSLINAIGASEQNRAVATPTASADCPDVSQSYRRSSSRIDDDQFVALYEADFLTVRRPERLASCFGCRDTPSWRTVEYTNPERNIAAGIAGGESHGMAIRRDCRVTVYDRVVFCSFWRCDVGNHERRGGAGET